MSSFTPKPISLSCALRDERAVDSQRNLFCPLYDACLHRVVKQGWEGWSCRACSGRHLKGAAPQPGDYARLQPRSLELL